MSDEDMEFGDEAEPSVPAPITRPVRPQAPKAPDLHDRAAEAHVLSCLLLDPSKATLPAQAFHFPEHRLLYLSIQRLHAQGAPVELASIAADLSDHQQFTTVGEWPFLFQIENRSEIPTTLHLAHYAQRVTDLAERRAQKAHAEETLRAISAGQQPPEPPHARASQAPSLKARLPSSFAFVPSTHESVLIGNRWLSRGDGAILVSTSGMGKSSLGFELAADWALGLDFHGGLKPRVPLKTLIVQSEDGDGDVAEVYHSYCHAKRLTPDQTQTLDTNLRILTDRVHRGQALVSELKRHIALFAPDIIIINPLLAFIDGDLNSAEDAGRFLREQLNSLNEPARFAYLIIHHTAKPPKEKTERRWNEVMYDMAGSGDLTNWARAILSLRPCTKEGQFELHLPKRGRRAGYSKTVPQGVGTRQEPVIKIGLRYSDETFTPPGADRPIPLIHWEPCELEQEDDKPQKAKGRPEKHLFETYFAVFPPKDSQGKTLNQLWMALKDNGPIPKNSLHDICTRWKEQGDVEIIEQDGAPRRYRRTL